MRVLALSAAGVLVVSVVGCSERGKPSPAQAEPAAAGAPTPAPPGQECVIKSGGSEVLRLTVPASAKCTSDEGALHVRSRDGYFDIWAVPGAKTVEEGLAGVSDVIRCEFREFKGAASSEETVAGSPARRLKGTGEEADDGDPGTAEVAIFSAGGRVFVACTHGESLAPSAVVFMMSALRTAKAS